MANANVSNVTIRPEEAAHFGTLAREWWDPKGPMASLHQINPVRLRFVREMIDMHWSGNSRDALPLKDKQVLDVGCGAGLLCEPLARLGGQVTGVDASVENIGTASAHAAGAGLDIRYMAGELAQLDIGTFDLVTSMEVIEHVADKRQFLQDCAARLAPGGLMILSTPNRTAASRLLLVGAAEAVGYVPKGTHDWNDFITPEELGDLLGQIGLAMEAPRGIAWSLGKGLHLSEDMSLNYIAAVRKP